MVFAVTLLEMRILFVITSISNMNKKHAFFNKFHYKKMRIGKLKIDKQIYDN